MAKIINFSSTLIHSPFKSNKMFTTLQKKQTVIKNTAGLPKKLPFKSRKIPLISSFCTLFILLIFNPGCKKNVLHFLLNGYEQTNLVADTAGFGAAKIDPNLVNAWGVAFVPSGPIWISDNHTGLSTIYDKNGNTLRPPVTIPLPGSSSGGSPTGVVFNSTTDFMIKTGKQSQASRFIFATEDGTIAAWGGGNNAVIVADRSTFMAVYKGIAIANDGSSNFLYATNFSQAKIDVFDRNFNLVSGKHFHDPGIPAGFAPFNIRNINGWLYVTYAKQKPDHHDDLAGPGNGFVSIFRPDGSLVKRFASQGPLNSPWGIVQAKIGFCEESEESPILIGNFGDGRINVFSDDGKFLGPLKDDGRPISIDGLWSIENDVPTANPNQLFFTAGPAKETHGIFGFLEKRH
jgi:uncharacterized protein (TIGR03118 family)